MTESPKLLPVVTIIGRPNVGKSTLFNRLLGRKRSVTTPIPGTTRDRIEAPCSWGGRSFLLVDTAGLEGEQVKALEEDVAAQIEIARAQADLILFVVDGKEGLVGTDMDTAKALRRTGKPTLVVFNKADGAATRNMVLQEARRLGLGEPVATSAISGVGAGDLLDAIVAALGPAPEQAIVEGLKIGIFGRPNVGKSTLLNRLAGEERSIVSDIPGTTRDSIDILLTTPEGPVTIIDTAGIRRKAKIEPETIDQWVTKESLRTIARCDIVLLLVDAEEPMSAQDRRLAQHTLEVGTGLILVVNKWDLVRVKTQEENVDPEEAFEAFRKDVRRSFPFLQHIPILMISAKSGRSSDQVLGLARRVSENRSRMLPQEQIDGILDRVGKRTGTPRNEKGSPIKIQWLKQLGNNPPKFLFKTSRPKDILPQPYLDVIQRELRAAADFEGTEVRVFQRIKS